MVWVPQQSFAYGELSPSLHGLVTTQQYRGGCKTLTNALLTATGSARRRFGTEDIASTTSGFPAALFVYRQGGRRFVVQFVSQDDDAGDLNTANRQMRVLDADTRAFINFGDNQAHGRFTAFGDTSAYHHHFTATQLASVYAYQDGNRIVFCHPDRPPLFLERGFGASGVERWQYGVVASTLPPKVVDYSIPIGITELGSAVEVESTDDHFTPDDVGAYWRLGGPPNTTDTNFIYGSWFQTTKFRTRRRMSSARVAVSGDPNGDPFDWSGPYKPTANSTATISASSSGAFDVRIFTITAGITPESNHIGSPVLVAGTTLWLVISNPGASQLEAIRLGGVGTVTGAGLTFNVHAVGYSTTLATGGNRPWFRKHPVYPTAIVPGAASLYSIAPLFVTGGITNHPWIVPGHETLFDKIGANEIGGTVHLNGGTFAITSTVNTTGGVVYNGRIVQPLSHQGPTVQYGLGWSHGVGFPRCGVAHQARHYFGGFKLEPSSIVGSKTGQPQDFRLTDEEDSAILLRLTDPSGGLVNWMESSDDLLIGTTTGEGYVAGEPITPTQLAWQRQTGYGGLNIRPALVGGAAIFASGKGLREMAFVFDRDGYLAPDLTDIAKHLFEDRTIAQIEYVAQPLQVVFIRFTSGAMVSLSYWRENEVVGFSGMTQPVYPTSSGAASEESTIESMTAVRGDPDELWVVRRFTSGGQSGAGSVVRRIERMSASFVMDQSWSDSTPTSTALGAAPHLIDLSQTTHRVQILLDGVYIGNAAVDGSGNASYSDTGTSPTTGVLGREIRFEMAPLVQAPEARDGATMGRITNTKSGIILLRESRGGTIDGKNIKDVVPATTVTTPITERTGWFPVVGLGEHGRLEPLNIVHTAPYHFEVAALNVMTSFGEGG